METKTYRYEDPTGGGGDAELKLPITFKPPPYLTVKDFEDENYCMDLAEETEE